MPPKRKAAAAKKAAGGKKAKPEDEEKATMKEAFEALKAADAGKIKKTKVDKLCPYANTAAIVDDFDCMLNQTNIGHNNNKYYVIQVLQQGAQFYAWNRWGRVGEPGQNAIKGPMGKDGAVADFKKKFKDKTKNNWDDRKTFKPVAGKYTMIEMDDGGDEEDEEEMAKATAKLDQLDGVKRKTAECTLDKPTQSLVKLIFDNDMFKEAMQTFHIDVKKMPLGKLSKTQIAKGFEALEEIQTGIEDKKAKKNLTELTSKFYTLIPHDFGRQRPPVINTLELVREKLNMLMVLADIELAQAMQKEDTKKKKTETTEEVPHPHDVNYERLNCSLELVDKKSKEFKMLEKYKDATGGQHLKIQDIWRVERDGEVDRYNVHKNINERKLLWHGTNTAVVAAILKGGLRIMPHSGGRVGRGIYFASENSKSAGYVGTTGRTGIMFLNEVALGKEHTITTDDWRLTKAPAGCDCIVARGRTEPNPKDDITIDSVAPGKKVVVPQGKVITTKYTTSNFSQSEYLVYKESQNHMRYLLKLTF